MVRSGVSWSNCFPSLDWPQFKNSRVCYKLSRRVNIFEHPLLEGPVITPAHQPPYHRTWICLPERSLLAGVCFAHFNWLTMPGHDAAHPCVRFPCCHQQLERQISLIFILHFVFEHISFHFNSIHFIPFLLPSPLCSPLWIGEASKINEILFGLHRWGFSWFGLRFAFMLPLKSFNMLMPIGHISYHAG